MKKISQIQPVDATVPAVPEQVGVAMAEIAGNMREGLLAPMTCQHFREALIKATAIAFPRQDEP
jgi:hypothetical protein